MRNAIATMSFVMMATSVFAKSSPRHSTGLIVPSDADYGVPFLKFETDPADLPESFDLRTLGHMGPVRNQGSCGSCWAFAGVAAMESAMLKAHSQEFNFSEQELVSCDKNSYGCSGGWQPFGYMVKNGIGLESDFPYAGRNLSCKKIPAAAKAMRFANVGAADRRATVDEVRQAVHDFGGLWISVGANSSWQNNSSGVITKCSNTTVNHAVTVAGFEPVSDAPGKFRFLIKNSWGTNWSDGGYVKTSLGCNNLGRHITFVVPEDHACAPPEFGLPKKMDMGRAGGLIPVPGLEAAGLEYSWYKVGDRFESEGPIVVTPGVSADYVVRTRTTCGVWTQKLRVNAK